MSNESIFSSGDVRIDERTGRPRKIRGDFPLPQGDAGNLPELVRAFLQQNSTDVKVDASVENLELIQDVSTPARRILRFQQKVDGIPVFNGVVIAQLDSENRVRQIDVQQPVPGRPLAPAGDVPISANDALQSVVQNLGEPALRQQPEPPKQVYFPTDAGLKLAYLMLVPTRDPLHDWQIVVDAYTGEVLHKEDLIKYQVHVNGQGLVFDPNPVITAGNNTFRDPDATVAACGFAGTARNTIDQWQVSGTLRDITLENGMHRLEGLFVRMRNFGAPNIAPPEEANANGFNYSSGDDRFEAVNVYYHVDTLQRYVQSLGITNANNRQIECDAHDNTIDAAWYSPVDRGLHFSDSGPCRPDRGEDGEVMYHEYGHAMQDNQVPGWGGTNPTTGRNETGAMGEGFGDALACIYFAPDHAFQREVFEDWVFADTAGLRRVDGSKVYPAGTTGIVAPWTGSVHADGEIWSAALWNIYRALGGDSVNVAERRAARDAILKSVILSHFSMATNGTMPDGAEAVMETHAELNDYLGKHLMQMLDSFHARGILPCSPQADLYIREDVSDPGVDLYTGPVFWNSPDLWIRNANDNGTTHQNPEAGQDNWFYARVRNRGTATARAFVVTFNVKPWAGTQFTYPVDFLPCIAAAIGFDLPLGGSQVVRARWPAALVPPVGTHACWLASVYSPTDRALAGRHVWEHNNLAQKNLVIVDVLPDSLVLIPVQLGSLSQRLPELHRVEIRRPPQWSRLAVSLTHRDAQVVRELYRSAEGLAGRTREAESSPVQELRLAEPARIEIAVRGARFEPTRLLLGAGSRLDLDAGMARLAPPRDDPALHKRQADLITDRTGAASIAFHPGTLSGFPVLLKPGIPLSVGLKVAVPEGARPGDTIELHIVQRSSRSEVIGGVTVQLNVQK